METTNSTAGGLTDIFRPIDAYNLWDDFITEKLTCSICKTVVTTRNLGALIPKGDTLVLICSKGTCVNSYLANSS